jgi:two-component system response regulator YesN
MYTILVADDEPIVRENIIYMLGQNENAPFLILEAGNGSQALTILKAQNVDVLLADVRMPGISGLDLMTWISESGWSGKYLIISGYSRFEYAHKALECGASHYILKPIDERELHSAVNSVLAEIQKEESASSLEFIYTAQRRENRFLRMEALLNRQLAESLTDSPKNHEVEAAFAMGVMLCNADGVSPPRGDIRGLMLSLTQGKGDFGLLANYANDRELILLYYPGEGGFDGEAMTRLSLSAREALEAIGAMPFVSYAIAASPDGSLSLTEAHTLCHERLKSRFSVGRVFYTDLPTSCDVCGGARDEDKQRLAAFIHSLKDTSDGEALKEKLRKVFTAESLAEWPIGISRRVLRTVYGELRKLGAPRDCCDCGSTHEPATPDRFDTAEELVAHLAEAAHGLALTADIGGNFRQSRQQILNYIHANYSGNLTMADVAERFCFHPNYFSGAFHEMIGVSFSDYVTSLRLREAVRLLQESSLSIRVIAEAVGYTSQSYFQRVFKKEVGITPMEYRIKK